MTASHVVPAPDAIEPGHRIVVAVRAENATKYLTVEEREILVVQPDICILRVNEGVPPLTILCPTPVGIWHRVRSMGIPEALVTPEGAGFRIVARGFAGVIQRRIPAGTEIYAQGDSYELSFPVPAGASGSPVFVYTETPSEARGLVGVAIGNAETSSLAWSDDSELRDGRWQPTRTKRVVEFGIAADLLSARRQPVALAGGLTLEEVSAAEHYS